MSAQKAPERLGEKLRQIRLNFGHTLDEMADALGRSGVSRRARVHEWETGKRVPDLNTLLSYARLAKTSTDTLLDDEQELHLKSQSHPKKRTE